MVDIGGWCAPKARARKDGLPKEMACRGIGVSQKQGMRLQRKSQAAWARNPCYEKNQITWRCAAKGWRGRPQTSSVSIAPSSPPQRRPPAFGKEPLWSARPAVRSRPSGATQHRWGKSGLGALLRERKVTGRDASLPAPLLTSSFELVARGTVGALPQTPQGTLSLDPARGIAP